MLRVSSRKSKVTMSWKKNTNHSNVHVSHWVFFSDCGLQHNIFERNETFTVELELCTMSWTNFSHHGIEENKIFQNKFISLSQHQNEFLIVLENLLIRQSFSKFIFNMWITLIMLWKLFNGVWKRSLLFDFFRYFFDCHSITVFINFTSKRFYFLRVINWVNLNCSLFSFNQFNGNELFHLHDILIKILLLTFVWAEFHVTCYC
jgi:hypothetical protein